jgi:hypothetical protein
MPHKENIVIINFTDRKVLTTGTVLPRNPRWWKGEIEPKVTHVMADDPEIVNAYSRVGVPEYKEEQETVKYAEGGTERSVRIPDDLNSLPWHKLRSLACYLAPEGVKVKDKDDAFEVINNAL